MSRTLIGLGWFLGAGLLLAQAPPEPMPPPTPAEPIKASPKPLPEALRGGKEPAKLDLERLRQEVDKLRAGREALDATMKNVGEPDGVASNTSSDVDKAQLRLRLAELLTKMSTRGDVSKGRLPPGGWPLLPNRLEPGAGGDADAKGMAAASDTLALAQSLFQAGDSTGALQAYQSISLAGLRLDERAAIQYMIATCYRKMNKLEEASNRYREVVELKSDDFIGECAQWQLETLRWRRDLEQQLDKLKQRREAQEAKK